MTVLTLDLGNSALKWVHWTAADAGAGEPDVQSCSWEEEWCAALGHAVKSAAAHGDDLSIVISSVVNEERSGEVRASCAERTDAVFLNPPPALEIACDEPQTIGRDRLYAALGAWRSLKGPAIVLDAGTALTVDAVEGRERACFLGGAIAPGPRLLMGALATGGAQLFDIDLEGQTTALGRNSEEALRAGVRIGFCGAAAELVRRVSQEAELEDAPVVLTGGARGFLMQAGLFGERPVLEDPRLVHRGLLASLPNPR